MPLRPKHVDYLESAWLFTDQLQPRGLPSSGSRAGGMLAHERRRSHLSPGHRRDAFELTKGKLNKYTYKGDLGKRHGIPFQTPWLTPRSRKQRCLLLLFQLHVQPLSSPACHGG